MDRLVASGSSMQVHPSANYGRYMIYVYATNHAEVSIINYMAHQVRLSLLQVGTDIMECIYVH